LAVRTTYVSSASRTYESEPVIDERGGSGPVKLQRNGVLASIYYAGNRAKRVRGEEVLSVDVVVLRVTKSLRVYTTQRTEDGTARIARISGLGKGIRYVIFNGFYLGARYGIG
jgi:hypothetical protein